MSITRRDFLNGFALTVAAGLSPRAALAQLGPASYPPALTGLRGSHDGSYEAAHRLGLSGESFDLASLPSSEERYDLVVVGAGLSGLAAAWFHRRVHPGARVLILDNHDDFGGHARRNEFTVGGRLLLGYGGSETLDSPASHSDVVKELLRELGVEVARFETAFDRELYPSLGMGRGIFFDRETFGEDRLVTGDPTRLPDEWLRDGRAHARPIRELIADFPLGEADRAALLDLHETPRDHLAGLTAEEKRRVLDRITYRDFLIGKAGLSEAAASYFQNRSLDLFAAGADLVAARTAQELDLPGFAGLGLGSAAQGVEAHEPYIHHFPDGNASIARLLVRELIPAAAPGRGMDSIVLAPFDYTRLDEAGAPVRLRLNSTVVAVRRPEGPVELGYLRGGALERVRAEAVVLAGWNMMVPHLLPDLPDDQRTALAGNVKAPLVYANVALRGWQSFVERGVHLIHAPAATWSRTNLDFPVDLGGYRCPRQPDEPILVHMVWAPVAPNQGLDARAQYRAGRGVLLGTPFDAIEEGIRDQLRRMLGPGFDDGRDIAGLTVNRWSHGYAYDPAALTEEARVPEATMAVARRPLGRVAIANSDAGWSAYAQTAIDEAWRAVQELR
ncbi:NAD(P)-binding protein [Muricoccus radiodurans]|uniref:NAD(P)-binding protein n=1 Tax=Muricoccus radiodurans TaxID=2231721 RepID=UPI003CF11DA3